MNLVHVLTPSFKFTLILPFGLRLCLPRRFYLSGIGLQFNAHYSCLQHARHIPSPSLIWSPKLCMIEIRSAKLVVIHYSSFRCYSICHNIFLNTFFGTSQPQTKQTSSRSALLSLGSTVVSLKLKYFASEGKIYESQFEFFQYVCPLFTSLSPLGGMWACGLFNFSKQVSCSKSTPIYSTEGRKRGGMSWLHEYPPSV
jgi:hypothetical protein